MEDRFELVASYWTLSGTLPGSPREYSPYGFRERVEAASRAGFTGLGIWHADLDHIVERTSLAEMRRVLDGAGITRVEVEFLTDWFLDGERKRESDRQKRKLLAAAEALGAKCLKVGDFHRERCPMPRLVESFAALCADALDCGASVVFEPMSAAMIDTLSGAVEMVEGAGAGNGGLLIDLWHMVSLGVSYEEIARIPLRYLASVELDDAPIVRPGVHRDNAGTPRAFCGEGQFDIRGFVDCVTAAGYRGPWGVEIISEELLRMRLPDIARKAYATTLAALS